VPLPSTDAAAEINGNRRLVTGSGVPASLLFLHEPDRPLQHLVFSCAKPRDRRHYGDVGLDADALKLPAVGEPTNVVPFAASKNRHVCSAWLIARSSISITVFPR
jgi:hypothetical protein